MSGTRARTRTSGWYSVGDVCRHEIRVKVDVAHARDVTGSITATEGRSGTGINGIRRAYIRIHPVGRLLPGSFRLLLTTAG